MLHMQFEQCLQREVATAEKDKDGFIKEFSEADYEAVVGGWKVRVWQCRLLQASYRMILVLLCLEL